METLIKYIQDGEDSVSVIKNKEDEIVIEHDTEGILHRINLTRMGGPRPEIVNPTTYKKGKHNYVDLGTQSPEGYNPLSLTWKNLEGNEPPLPEAEKQFRKILREAPYENSTEGIATQNFLNSLDTGHNTFQEKLQKVITTLMNISLTMSKKGWETKESTFIHLIEHEDQEINEIHTFPHTPKGRTELVNLAHQLLEVHFAEIDEHEGEIKENPTQQTNEAIQTLQQSETWKSPTLSLTIL